MDISEESGPQDYEYTAEQTEHLVEFHGTAKEYFGIWIVNVLLSIITLGVYGAWAKVRDKKYFYGNTYIDDQNFTYHARGLQIFIGRMIVLLATLGLSASPYVSLSLYFVLLIVFLGFLPWLICRALIFNARVSSYRNVKFNFTGGYGGALLSYIVLPIVSVFTLYFLSPVASQQQQEFVINGHEYGNRKFRFRADIGPYFAAYFIALGLGIVLLIAVTMIAGASMMGSLEALGNIDVENPGPGIYAAIIGLYVAVFIGIIPAFLFYQARLRNIAYNNMILDDRHRFRSEVRARDYIGIILSNAIIVLLTFGLMMPWARVRLARYLASKTTLIAGGPLDVYSGEVGDDVGVVSSEYFDMEGIDIGIGI